MSGMEETKKYLSLLRLSDTFFPLGSFAMSQGMEELVSEHIFEKQKIPEVISLYLEKIWKTYDYKIFKMALEKARTQDIEGLIDLDNLCYVSKLTEESRFAMIKMGKGLLTALLLQQGTLAYKYKEMIGKGTSPGTYPVALAIVSEEMGLGELGAISLIYINLMEVIASLVRMGYIDYIEAQNILSKIISKLTLNFDSTEISQSFPAVDIFSMRHELNPNRMFIN